MEEQCLICHDKHQHLVLLNPWRFSWADSGACPGPSGWPHPSGGSLYLSSVSPANVLRLFSIPPFLSLVRRSNKQHRLHRDTPCPWCPWKGATDTSGCDWPTAPYPAETTHPVHPQFGEEDAVWNHIKGFTGVQINESVALPVSPGGVSPPEKGTGWVGNCSWCWKSQERIPDPSHEMANHYTGPTPLIALEKPRGQSPEPSHEMAKSCTTATPLIALGAGEAKKEPWDSHEMAKSWKKSTPFIALGAGEAKKGAQPWMAKPCTASTPFWGCPCQKRLHLSCQDDPRVSPLLRQNCQGEKWSGKGSTACSQNICLEISICFMSSKTHHFPVEYKQLQ